MENVVLVVFVIISASILISGIKIIYAVGKGIIRAVFGLISGLVKIILAPFKKTRESF